MERLIPKLPDGPVVFVGDYVDRGEDSAGVLRRLFDLETTREKVTCLMGNHEHFVLDFLEKPAQAGPRWLRHGGLQTLASFSVTPPSGPDVTEADWDAARDKLRSALGPDLETWIAARPALWRSGNVAVVHAGADPAQPIEAQKPGTLIWGHPDFDSTARTDGIWVVHGHTIVGEPGRFQGRVPIDTGAYATGQLTAALIDEDQVSFLSA